MTDPHLAQVAAVIGALGVPLALTLRGRAPLLFGLAMLATAEAMLTLALVPAADLRRLWESPRSLLALGVGLFAVCALAGVLARSPSLAPVALLVCAPIRIPVELGGQRASLLVPLYAALAAAVLALVWRVVRSETPEPPTRYLAVPVTGFTMLAAVSLLWSQDVRAGTIQLVFFLLPFSALLAVVARAPLRQWSVHVLAATLVVLTTVFALVGIWQAWTKRLFFAPDLEVANAYTTFFRVTSLFKDPSLYGRHLVLGFAVLLVALWLGRARLEVVAPLAGVLWIGLYFSYSQSSLVALFVVVVAATVAAGTRLARRGAAVAVVACIVVGGAFVAATVHGQSARRFTSGRSELVSDTVAVFARHPLAGVGIGAQPLAAREVGGERGAVVRNASHTTPLTVAAELGIAGLAAYLLILAGAGVAIRRLHGRDVTLGLGLAVILIALVTHSLVYSGFFEDPLVWGTLGIAAAALAASRGSLIADHGPARQLPATGATRPRSGPTGDGDAPRDSPAGVERRDSRPTRRS